MGDNAKPTAAKQASREPTEAEKIVQLGNAVNSLMSQVNSLQTFKGIKANKAEVFEGKRSTLRRYLTSMDMHIRINNLGDADESDKVMFAGTYLRGPAFDWFEPHMRDFQDNPDPDNRKDSTDTVFDSYQGFKKQITKAFGDPDAEKTAERRMYALKQGPKMSIGELTSKFHQIASNLDWEDKALRSWYYQILKPEIKDAMMYMPDKPNTLDKMIDVASGIENRLVERHYETRQRWGQLKTNQFGKRYHRDRDGDIEMQLNAAITDPAFKGNGKDKRKFTGKCFKCDKPGHMARHCQSKQKKGLAIHDSQINAAYTTTEPMMKALQNDDDTLRTAGQEEDDPGKKMRLAIAKRAFRYLMNAVENGASKEEKRRGAERFEKCANELNDDDFTELREYIRTTDDVEKHEGRFMDPEERLAQKSRAQSPKNEPRVDQEDRPTEDDDEISFLADEFHGQLAVTDVARTTDKQQKDREETENDEATSNEEWEESPWETEDDTCNCEPAKATCGNRQYRHGKTTSEYVTNVRNGQPANALSTDNEICDLRKSMNEYRTQAGHNCVMELLTGGMEILLSHMDFQQLATSKYFEDVEITGYARIFEWRFHGRIRKGTEAIRKLYKPLDSHSFGG